jgi:phosphatidylserine decarboxylase
LILEDDDEEEEEEEEGMLVSIYMHVSEMHQSRS